MKGYKRNMWRKDGIKVSRHWHKNEWNRKVRHNKSMISGGFYKRLAKKSAYDGIS